MLALSRDPNSASRACYLVHGDRRCSPPNLRPSPEPSSSRQTLADLAQTPPPANRRRYATGPTGFTGKDGCVHLISIPSFVTSARKPSGGGRVGAVVTRTWLESPAPRRLRLSASTA